MRIATALIITRQKLLRNKPPELKNSEKKKRADALIKKLDVEAAEFIFTPDIPAQRMNAWFIELVCLVGAFVLFSVIGILLTVLKVEDFEFVLGMAAIGVGGALLLSALIVQVAISVKAAKTSAMSYYMRTKTDFVSVTETRDYAAVYADGFGYFVENGSVKSFTRDEYLSEIEGKSCGLPLLLNVSRGELEYELTKKGEILVFTDDNGFDHGAFFVNGNLFEVSTVAKRGAKPRKRNYVRTVKTPIALIKHAESYTVLLSERTANAIKAAGYELNHDYFEVKEVL